MNFNTELKKNIGCNIVYSSSDGGNYSIILMEFDSGNRIMVVDLEIDESLNLFIEVEDGLK